MVQANSDPTGQRAPPELSISYAQLRCLPLRMTFFHAPARNSAAVSEKDCVYRAFVKGVKIRGSRLVEEA